MSKYKVIRDAEGSPVFIFDHEPQPAQKKLVESVEAGKNITGNPFKGFTVEEEELETDGYERVVNKIIERANRAE